MTHKPGAFYLTKISVQQNNELAGFCIELTVFDVFLFLDPYSFFVFPDFFSSCSISIKGFAQCASHPKITKKLPLFYYFCTLNDNLMNDLIGQFTSKALSGLKERAKELKCMYAVEESLKNPERNPEEVFRELLDVIPLGWQFTTVCECRIIYEGKHFFSTDFKETEWFQTAEINIDGNIAGEIQVYYTQLIRLTGDSQFLPEEQKLLNTIAERLSRYVFYQKLKKSMEILSTVHDQAQHPTTSK
jgi:hypothetical protein